MIAIQKTGKDLTGALRYHLKKLNYPDIRKLAELLDTNFTSLNLVHIAMEVQLLRSLRPKLNNYVSHTSVSFPTEDRAWLYNDKMVSIGLDYLEGNGFTNNQYLIFRHYDTGNEHMHLLVNRINFEGNVVPDSYNYERSETVIRNLEIKYGLKQERESKTAPWRAAKRAELEMVLRTGRPSHKMVLQELISGFLEKDLTIPALIAEGELRGVNFLFNQAPTGEVTGLCYFYDGFKTKGRSLGNRFKWAELIKNVNYEQDRDRQTIGEANSRTRAKYGDWSGDRQRGAGFSQNHASGPPNDFSQPAIAGKIGKGDRPGRERSLETGQNAALADIAADDRQHPNHYTFTIP